MQLLHIQLGRLPHAAPQNRAPVVMHFQHVSLCFFARIAEDPLENHGHIAHQVHWIVMDYYLPRKIEIFFRTRLFFDRRLRGRYGPRLLVRSMSEPLHFFNLRHALSVPPWPATHAEKANIRRLQFKPASNCQMPIANDKVVLLSVAKDLWDASEGAKAKIRDVSLRST